MPTMSNLPGWAILVALLCHSVSCQITSDDSNAGASESRSRLFSPRVDYDEWTPLGRGDPLKNDPTFDYVPPVLDRVQYWLDSHTTEPSTKRDILVLGVTAKKTSPKIPEQFLKFVDGPKFNRNQEQYRNEPSLHRNDFTGSSGAEPPKLIRTTNFRNGGVADYRNQNRIQNIPASYYPSPFYNQKPKPYTMMRPPPIMQKPAENQQQSKYNVIQKDKVSFPEQMHQFNTQTEEGPVMQPQPQQTYNAPAKNAYSQPHPPPPLLQPQVSSKPSQAPSKNVVSQIETIKSVYTPPARTINQRFEGTTVPSISFEKSNLIYQSSQTISGGWLANNGPALSESNQVTWQTPANVRDHYETGDHQAAASSSHEVVIGQNANIIVDGESNENEEVVIGQKEASPPAGPTSTAVDADVNVDSDAKMHIVMANTSSEADSTAENEKLKTPIAVVMPTNYVDRMNTTWDDQTPPQFPSNFTGEESSSPASSSLPSNAMMSETQQNPVQVPNSIPPRNLSPMRFEETRPPFRMTPPNSAHPLSMHPLSRHPPSPSHLHSLFEASNAQHPTHVMTQYLPNGHSHAGYRPPMIMSHAHPPPPPPPPLAPMTYMQPGHANVQPPKNAIMMMMMGPHVNANQSHRPQQHRPMQSPMMFTEAASHASPPPTSTPPLQATRIPQSPASEVSNGHMKPFLPTLQTPVAPPETPMADLESVTDYITNRSPLASILNNETRRTTEPPSTPPSSTSLAPSTTSVATTTTASSLTTDPIFSHYKQPAKPIRGPMYLIIQGHSKVKTYKPSVNKHGVPVENNEILESTTELSELERLIIENTRSSDPEKSLPKRRVEAQPEETRTTERGSLLSLVESGFSAFTVPPPPATEEERPSNSVTTIEINN